MKAYRIKLGDITDEELNIIGEKCKYYFNKEQALKCYKEGEYTVTEYRKTIKHENGIAFIGHLNKQTWEYEKEQNKNPAITYTVEEVIYNKYKIEEIDIQ